MERMTEKEVVLHDRISSSVAALARRSGQRMGGRTIDSTVKDWVSAYNSHMRR